MWQYKSLHSFARLLTYTRFVFDACSHHKSVMLGPEQLPTPGPKTSPQFVNVFLLSPDVSLFRFSV